MPREIPNNPRLPKAEQISAEGILTRQEKAERRQRRGGGESVVNRFKFNRPEYEREGYKRYWAADTGVRLDELYNQDYEYVLDANGNKIKQFGGFDKFGNRFDHYLMEKPLDWYEEDKKKKSEASMRELEIKNNNTIDRAARGLNIYRPQIENNAALAEID